MKKFFSLLVASVVLTGLVITSFSSHIAVAVVNKSHVVKVAMDGGPGPMFSPNSSTVAIDTSPCPLVSVTTKA